MRRLGCFGAIVLILLGIIAYQYWRINQLSSQLAAIATKVHSGQASKDAAKNHDLASALAEAQRYTNQAQKFLSSRNVAQAQKNLDKAKQKLNAAGEFSKNIYDSSSDFLGKARSSTVKVFNKAWKDISTDDPKSKVESRKSDSRESKK